MGQHSKIEWTHHTFNPWWGCVKVSEACKFCYAETFAKRVGMPVWGFSSPRRFFGNDHWSEPVKWNKRAAERGVSERVFCASMADVFEELSPGHPDEMAMAKARERLWLLIGESPNLDWLLLTKRPENVLSFLPARWQNACPSNVWIGATIEDEKTAKTRVPHLLKVPARVRFVSCEPLLGSLSLREHLGPRGINWVIAGGESGPKARPTEADWVRQLRDECLAAGVPFHFKQWGTWRPLSQGHERLGKGAAGRDLDGRTWDGVPPPRRSGAQACLPGALG